MAALAPSAASAARTGGGRTAGAGEYAPEERHAAADGCDRPKGDQASFEIDQGDGRDTVTLHGDWTVASIGDVPSRLAASLSGGGRGLVVDAAALGRVDTTGAYALLSVLQERDTELRHGDREDLARLAELVRGALNDPLCEVRTVRREGALEGLGRAVAHRASALRHEQEFVGRVVVGLVRLARRPRRMRWTALFWTMQRAGLAAVPIVASMTFFIGAVLALVGSTMLPRLGVTAYAVELVGIGVLREFGAVIAAILFAGRSGSAFAAQVGSMCMNQEVSAMRVMDIDVDDALVLPRVVASLLVLPLLTIVADLGGLFGGMLVTWFLLGIEPSFFLERLLTEVGSQQFWLGLVKAPVFALVVAAIACREGLATKGDVESLGGRVTEPSSTRSSRSSCSTPCSPSCSGSSRCEPGSCAGTNQSAKFGAETRRYQPLSARFGGLFLGLSDLRHATRKTAEIRHFPERSRRPVTHGVTHE